MRVESEEFSRPLAAEWRVYSEELGVRSEELQGFGRNYALRIKNYAFDYLPPTSYFLPPTYLRAVGVGFPPSVSLWVRFRFRGRRRRGSLFHRGRW